VWSRRWCCGDKHRCDRDWEDDIFQFADDSFKEDQKEEDEADKAGGEGKEEVWDGHGALVLCLFSFSFEHPAAVGFLFWPLFVFVVDP
jgi:hypothetical protein